MMKTLFKFIKQIKKTVLKASQRAAWQDLHDIADKSTSKIAKLFLEANKNATSELNKGQLTKAIASGTDILPQMQELAARNYELIWPTILDVFFESADAAISVIPAKRKVRELLKKANTINFTFNRVNPDTVFFLQSYRLDLIRELSQATRDGIREILVLGAKGQLTPRQMSRQIVELNGFGLTEFQAKSADNFRRKQEAAIIKEKLKRQLDTKRLTDDAFDFVRDRHLLTASEGKRVEKRLGTFQKRSLRKRAMTIARTETIRSANAGQQEAWAKAQESGFLESDARQRWIITNDNKVSDICRGIKASNPDGVLLGQPFAFSSSDPPMTIPVMRPGDSHVNCRCALDIKQ